MRSLLIAVALAGLALTILFSFRPNRMVDRVIVEASPGLKVTTNQLGRVKIERLPDAASNLPKFTPPARPPTLAPQSVVEKISLTPDQRTRFERALDANGERLRAAMVSPDREGFRDRLKESLATFREDLVRDLGEEKAEEVLAAMRQEGARFAPEAKVAPQVQP